MVLRLNKAHCLQINHPVGVATFKNTIDVDADIKDQNDDTGTSVAESLSADITDAIYNSTTGVMVLTIANHGFANGDSIKIPDGTIKLSCNYKGVNNCQSYPRSKDPNSGKWLVISNKTTNTFQVNVGDGGLCCWSSTCICICHWWCNTFFRTIY